MVAPRMFHTTDLAAYAAAGVSVALSAAGQVSGLEIANEIVSLIGGLIGIASGGAGFVYFVRNWKKRK